MLGIFYFLIFQLIGILLGLRAFSKEKAGFGILLGSVFGNISLQWLPVIFAFFFDFTITAHILGLVVFLLIFFALCYVKRKEPWPAIRFEFHPVLLLLIPLFIFFVVVVWHHTLNNIDGNLYTGQSTNGDMNMHLGFITSIATQKTFPPNYSILPGTKLAYPFLSDSISSSLYLMGTSLRVAYVLPMYAAILQVFFGFYCLALELVKKKKKAFLAFVFFFLNGGFGLIYCKFPDMFTAFYETPTNFTDHNIRWVNTIADMLIPQRATLFGWAVLFPTLYLLYRAYKMNKDNKSRLWYFVAAGILGGSLPLIHTHSFMALGLICTTWLLLELLPHLKLRYVFLVLLIVLALLVHINLTENEIASSTLFAFGIAGVLFVLGLIVWGIIKNRHRLKSFLPWLVFLGIVLVMALPQLLGFTFKQAGNDGFLRGNLNWCNTTDEYFTFYFINIGIVFILLILGFFLAKKQDIHLLAPTMLIWFLAELIVFQPNTYDNNKLLFVAYAFICCFTASVFFDTLERINIKSSLLRWILTGIIVVVASISGILTLGREYYSDQSFYEQYPPLYTEKEVELVDYIKKNTANDAVFLTATNHDNAVAALTGRNIVCGSSIYLYFHGLDYQQQENDVSEMYNAPVQNKSLFTKYNVSYILLSEHEFNTYPELDETGLLSMGETIYKNDELTLIKVNP